MTIGVAQTRERIAAAREAIGAGASDDYVIAPLEHAAQLQNTAPELAELLRSSKVEVIARKYVDRDAAALRAQTEFRAVYRRARAAVFTAGVAAALIMVAGSVSSVVGEPWSTTLLVTSSVIGVVAGGLAGLWIRRIRDGRLLEAWMTRRAAAEAERLHYFEVLTRTTPFSEPLLLLEYFRRYQLDVQRAYYATRGERHRAEAENALSRSSAGVALASIASGVAGVLAIAVSPIWAALAGFGLLGQAFASAVENGEATSQDRRNAERYARTRELLDQLYAMLDSVREATAAGELEILPSYVESVQDQLSLEHRQWLEELGATSHAVGRLQELLEHYGDKLPKAR